MSSNHASANEKVCWDCIIQKPEKAMTKDEDCGLVIWRCGCDKGVPPFMTAVAGHVMFHHGITGKTLPDCWSGICVSGDSSKAFGNIGRDNSERSFQKLPVTITTLREAKKFLADQEIAKQQALAEGKVARAIWKSLLNVRAVVCEQLPAGLNSTWIVMNAPRPLLGDQVVENGPYHHGRYYAAIDPEVEFAAQLVERNLRDDARVVFVADKELQENMAYQLIALKYRHRYEAFKPDSRRNVISTYVEQLHEDKTLVELKEMARAANLRLMEEGLLSLPNQTTFW